MSVFLSKQSFCFRNTRALDDHMTSTCEAERAQLEAAAGVGVSGDEEEVVANREGRNVGGQLSERRQNEQECSSSEPTHSNKWLNRVEGEHGAAYLRVSSVQVRSVRQAEETLLKTRGRAERHEARSLRSVVLFRAYAVLTGFQRCSDGVVTWFRRGSNVVLTWF